MKMLETQNDPEWCAHYINWRLDAATKEIDESKKKYMLKSVFGYICSMEKVKYPGWNLQEIAISKINTLNADALLYFKTLAPEDYTNEGFNKNSIDKVVWLLSNRLKQLDTNFKW
jgi:hypothetical protein